MYNISFDEKAKEMITQKSDSVTIKMVKSGGGWCGPVIKPAVVAGKPDDIENYTEIESDGITAYVSKELKVSPDGIKVEFKGIGPFKQLVLDGIE